MKKAIHTEELQKEKFIKCIERGASFAASSRATGLSRSYIFCQRRDNTEFGLAVDVAVESRIIVVEDALMKNARKGNVIAQIFYLKNRASHRWTDRTELEFIAPRVVNRKAFIQAGEEPVIKEGKVPGKEIVKDDEMKVEEILTTLVPSKQIGTDTHEEVETVL